MTRLVTTAFAALCLHLVPLHAQLPPRAVRDSVSRLVHRLSQMGGNFAALGDYDGDRAPFDAIHALFATNPDSVLVALVDCFGDTAATRLRFKGAPMVRGAACYIFLQHLIYRETDPDEHWPGNFYDQPTPERLRAAQQAWREAVLHHWYSES